MATVKEAYRAGYMCGLHGPDEDNCHFAFFESAEKTAAWQRGKGEGECDRLPKGLAYIGPKRTDVMAP